jgi:hypothetical protein
MVPPDLRLICFAEKNSACSQQNRTERGIEFIANLARKLFLKILLDAVQSSFAAYCAKVALVIVVEIEIVFITDRAKKELDLF